MSPEGVAVLMCTLILSSFPARARPRCRAKCPDKPACYSTSGIPPGAFVVDLSCHNLTQLPSNLSSQTQFLLLGSNNITRLPDRAFSNCTDLRHLDLSSNYIKDVEDLAFAGIDKLHTLFLNNNSINFSSVSTGLFQNLKSLQTLLIQDNIHVPDPSEEVDEADHYNDELFTPLENLQCLEMDGLRNATFGQGFKSLRRLEYLGLHGNLQYITGQTFLALNGSQLKTLVVGSGVLLDVDRMAFFHFKHLDELDLSFNPGLGFTNVSKAWFGLKNTKISQITLVRSVRYNFDIVKVDSCFLVNLQHTKLKRLSLDANNIVTIDAFFSLFTRHLEYLSLAYNRLVQVWGLMLDIVLLPHLGVVDASFQSKRLYDDYGHRQFGAQGLRSSGALNCTNLTLPDIVTLSLETNRGKLPTNTALPELTWKKAMPYIPQILSNKTLIEQLLYRDRLLIEGVGYVSKTLPLPPGTLVVPAPPSLRELNAAASLTINVDTIFEITVVGETQIRVFNYSRNSIERFMGPIEFSSLPPCTVHVDLSHNDCSFLSPNFFGHLGSKIDTLELGHNNLGHQLEKDTDGEIFQQLTRLETLDLSLNNIKSLHKNIFLNKTNLQNLSLQHNSLRFTDFLLSNMTNLRVLDLSGNLLDQLDLVARQIIDRLASRVDGGFTLDLTENPLQCSCNTLPFLKWLPKTTATLTNSHSYVCKFNQTLMLFGKNLRNLQNVILPHLQEDCHSKAWLIASSIVLASVAVLIVISLVLYRHRFEIRYLCLRFVVQRKAHQLLVADDTEYEYDAFVAFDQEDRYWIDEYLLPELDVSYGGEFRLMVHHRDFEPGKPIEENILTGIEASRKFVPVLSRRFVESNWCEFELQIANCRCFEEGKELVVAILIEEGFHALKMSKSLRALLKRNTYLQWPEDVNERPHFWRNLKKALSSKRERIHELNELQLHGSVQRNRNPN